MARGPYAAIAAAIVAVSLSSILIRWSESDAFTIAFYRLALATLIVLPYAVIDPPTPRRRLPRVVVLLAAGVRGLRLGLFALSTSSLDITSWSGAASVGLS